MKVKKEVSLAIFIGLIIALLVTGGILRARRAFQTLDLPSLKDKLTSQPTPAPARPELYLEVTTIDNSVSATPSLALTGKTLPGSFIAIL